MKKVLPYLLFFIFGLVVLGQLQRFELSLGRAVYLHEIMMVFFIGGVLSLSRRFTLNKIGIAFLLLNIWILLRSFGLTPFFYLVRLDLYILFGTALLQSVQSRIVTIKQIQWLVFVSIGLLASLGWLQYLLLPDTRGLVYLGWDDHYLRLIGTLFDPGFTGAILALGSLLMGRQLFSIKQRIGKKYALLQALWLITTGALLFTYSRASFVAYGIGLLYLFIRSHQRVYLVLLGFFTFLILLLPRPASEGARLERTVSIVARVDSVQSGLTTLSPIDAVIGKGWYASKNSSTRMMAGNEIGTHASAPDNSFIFLFTSLGIIGLLACGFFTSELIRALHWQEDMVIALIAMSVHALFSNTLLYPFVLFYITAIGSMAI